MDNKRMEESALFYAKLGFSVFPIKYKSKVPLTVHGFKDASKDVGTIRNWWKANPNANIGLALGDMSNGIFVIDLDIDKDRGVDGTETLRDWERAHKPLPDTANSITGRGGYHFFYHSNSPVESRVKILPGIDIRGNGGYVVAPPSIHPNGNKYEWENSIEDYDITEVDDVVNALLAEGKSNKLVPFSMPDKIEQGARNDTIYKMTCYLQSKGMSDETIRVAVESENQIRCVPPLDQGELDKIFASASKYEKGSITAEPMKEQVYITLIQTEPDKSGHTKVRQCAENYAEVMRANPNLAGKIKYNKLAYSPQYLGQLPWRAKDDTFGEWSDMDDSNLRSFMDVNYGLKSKLDYMDGFNIILNENSFNPIVDWLEALPKWDGKPHIDNLLPKYLGVENGNYSQQVMRLVMQGAISRAYRPGCKFDYMMVLVGEQGIGKSTFIQKLAVNPDWYDDNFNTVEGASAIERLRGKWILELAELLAVKRQKDVESIKAFLTTRNDSYRAPYAQRTGSRPRMCIFMGTTNDKSFLTDRTGNRRYLPIEVNRGKVQKSLFDDEQEVADDFNQAWAEALHIYKTQHTSLILPKELTDEVAKIQSDHLQDDPWVGIIQAYLDSTANGYVCIMELWKYALDMQIPDPKRPEIFRIHNIMRNDIVGWHEVKGKQRTKEFGIQRCYEMNEGRFEEVVEEVPF